MTGVKRSEDDRQRTRVNLAEVAFLLVFTPLLSCQLTDLTYSNTRILQLLLQSRDPNDIPPKGMKCKEDGWRQMWRLLVSVSLLLWDLRNEVVVEINVEANVDLILSRDWHAEGKILSRFSLETPAVWFGSQKMSCCILSLCFFLSLHCVTKANVVEGSIPLFGC